jgi:hypothetical protein
VEASADEPDTARFIGGETGTHLIYGCSWSGELHGLIRLFAVVCQRSELAEFQQHIGSEHLIDQGKQRFLLKFEVPARSVQRGVQETPGGWEIVDGLDLTKAVVEFLVILMEPVASAFVFQGMVERAQDQFLFGLAVVMEQAFDNAGQESEAFECRNVGQFRFDVIEELLENRVLSQQSLRDAHAGQLIPQSNAISSNAGAARFEI